MKKRLIILVLVVCSMHAIAQNKPDKELRLNLNDNGTHYLKTTFTAQIWGRYTETNPGSTSFGFEQAKVTDIGLRRVRTQLFGKVSDKVFVYTQFGINNFGYNSPRKSPIFFHDVLAEYQITPRTIQVGMGLTAWTGFSRFASPSVATIMGYDAPLFEQSTNDANDQFLRKLSVYAKGKIGKLDYRFIISNPFAAQNSTAIKPIGVNSDFSYKPTKMQSSAYLNYQFLDEESNLTPYMTGTYLGKKKVFNVGVGYEYQKHAMWHWNDAIAKDTINQDMLHYAVDVFYDQPIGSKGAAISIYAAAMHMGFGKNYLRNLGVMNPADGVTAGTTTINGAGNAFPMMGTGNVYYTQIGYLLPTSLISEKHGRFMPYVMYMNADFERLKQQVQTFDIGLNYFIEGHRAKITLDYQNRSVFNAATLKETTRKGMIVMQLQVAI
jgi:hypothetical protein